MNYRLLIDYAVIEFLETLPRGDQRLLRNRLVAIQNDPGKFADYREYDRDGHQVDINVCGKFAIKFWQDHADRHIKILDVLCADRPNT